MVNKSDPGYLYTVFYFEHVQLLKSKFDTTSRFNIMPRKLNIFVSDISRCLTK